MKKELIEALKAYNDSIVKLSAVLEQSNIPLKDYPLEDDFAEHTYKMLCWSTELIKELSHD